MPGMKKRKIELIDQKKDAQVNKYRKKAIRKKKLSFRTAKVGE